MVTARTLLATLVLCSASLWAQAVNPVPLINQPLVPSSIAPGSAQFSLTVEGTGFVPASVVEWNDVALATTFVNQGKLTAIVPAGDVGSNGTAEVTVINPAPGGGKSNPVLFTITNSTATVTFSASPPAGTVLVADFNNDGIPDLLVTAPGGGSILLGKGDGTFTTKSQISLATSFLVGAVAGDFNGDRQLDIATISNPQCMGCAEVTIFLGNGDGTFTNVFQTDGLDGDYFSIASADFNRDGKLDLVVTGVGFGINFLNVLLGTGDGKFGAGTGFGPPDIGTPDTVAIGDFNGDGILDLATDNPFAIFTGNGDATFSPLPQPGTFNVGSGLATADFNGDGILDLAFGGDATTGTLGILLGKGDGTFTQQTSTEPATGPVTAIGDLNGDGKTDLVVGASVYLGNGDGTFQDGIATTGQGTAFAGDFNRDGRLDLAFANAILLQVSEGQPGKVTVTLHSSRNPAIYGQVITFTATLKPQSAGTPTGTVVFYNGTTALGTVAVSGNTAKFVTASLGAGTQSISAKYSGDANFEAATSNHLREVIERASTTTKLTSSANPAFVHQSFTLTASVAPQFTGTPTGRVTFHSGPKVLAVVPLVKGVATLQVSFFHPGVHHFSASYSGNGNFHPSVSPTLAERIRPRHGRGS